jgi:superfamily II RNA helicase
MCACVYCAYVCFQPKEKSEWTKIITVLKNKNLLPVVCFAFSKKKCEELAFGLGNIDLNEKNEKAEVHQFIENSLQRLKGLSFVCSVYLLLFLFFSFLT